MKNLVFVLFLFALTQESCKKNKTCTCEDNNGKVVYNETTKVSGKTKEAQFDAACESRSTTYYQTTGSVTTSTRIPCVIS